MYFFLLLLLQKLLCEKESFSRAPMSQSAVMLGTPSLPSRKDVDVMLVTLAYAFLLNFAEDLIHQCYDLLFLIVL